MPGLVCKFMTYINFNQPISAEQIEGQRASLSASQSVKLAGENSETFEDFSAALKSVASKELTGQGSGEVSELYGILRFASRLEDAKLGAKELSKHGKVKEVKEDYNQEERRSFEWMIQEARRLNKLLNSYAEILGA